MADGSERQVRISAQGSARSVVVAGLKPGELIHVLHASSAEPSS
jgi:hypothetical protein